jgi:hypothetical protein
MVLDDTPRPLTYYYIRHAEPSDHPNDDPDSPCTRWLYDAFQRAHDATMEEPDAALTCVPSPMDTEPHTPTSSHRPTLLTTQWLSDWKRYVNTQVHTPASPAHDCACPTNPNHPRHTNGITPKALMMTQKTQGTHSTNTTAAKRIDNTSLTCLRIEPV